MPRDKCTSCTHIGRLGHIYTIGNHTRPDACLPLSARGRSETLKCIDRVLSAARVKTTTHALRFVFYDQQVREYERMSKDSAPARFDKVQAMRAKYIKQGSNFEINIECKMRDGIMKVCLNYCRS